ncbi:flagellin [Brevibacillus massiliensis]|uniref:flagellin N-terminal helical domain-containing protein n=1 Tax=Brevibacillus massiliensis TaxID=1118054 RepID=UPI0002DA2221|nr:flagellin [Brevibacillus massiliensis]
MIINHNISALNTHRQMGVNAGNLSKNVEKLSSGYRINRAADDAAGLSISERMRAQIRGMNQAARNSQDGISLIQTAEGSLQTVNDMLVRIKELATQSANGTYDDNADRARLQEEVTELSKEINNIKDKTKFNGIKLLDKADGVYSGSIAAGTNVVLSGTYSGTADKTITLKYIDATSGWHVDSGNGTFAQVSGASISGISFKTSGSVPSGVTSGTTITVTIKAKTPDKLDLQIGQEAGQTLSLDLQKIALNDVASKVSGWNIASQSGARTVLSEIENVINQVSAARSYLGANQNRLENTINNLNITSENLSAAESRIRDVDMAKEQMEFTKNNILVQASQAMLAQANQLPQGVLQLLR